MPSRRPHGHMNGSRAWTADIVNAEPPMSASTASARRPATVAGREHFGQGLRAAGAGNIAEYEEICVRNR